MLIRFPCKYQTTMASTMVSKSNRQWMVYSISHSIPWFQPRFQSAATWVSSIHSLGVFRAAHFRRSGLACNAPSRKMVPKSKPGASGREMGAGPSSPRGTPKRKPPLFSAPKRLERRPGLLWRDAHTQVPKSCMEKKNSEPHLAALFRTELRQAATDATHYF